MRPNGRWPGTCGFPRKWAGADVARPGMERQPSPLLSQEFARLIALHATAPIKSRRQWSHDRGKTAHTLWRERAAANGCSGYALRMLFAFLRLSREYAPGGTT